MITGDVKENEGSITLSSGVINSFQVVQDSGDSLLGISIGCCSVYDVGNWKDTSGDDSNGSEEDVNTKREGHRSGDTPI